MKRGFATGVVALVCLAAPAAVFAAGLTPIVPQQDCNGPGGCQSICDLALLAQNVLTDGIYAAVFLSAIIFAWAGWKMIVGSSSGNPGMIQEGKQILWKVTIGLVIIISAWIIVDVIMTTLGNNPQWNAFCSQSSVSVLEPGGSIPFV